MNDAIRVLIDKHEAQSCTMCGATQWQYGVWQCEGKPAAYELKCMACKGEKILIMPNGYVVIEHPKPKPTSTYVEEVDIGEVDVDEYLAFRDAVMEHRGMRQLTTEERLGLLGDE